MTNTRMQQLNAFVERTGIAFADLDLLNKALTHSSYANERKNSTEQHNQRLEFLGDAVLDLVVAEYLYRSFTSMPEGEMTKLRARLVCESMLASCAIKLSLGENLLLGKGEAASGGRKRPSILADAFEAVIGAAYIDGGYKSAEKFVLTALEDELTMISSGEQGNDYKTLLQELVQRDEALPIAYKILSEDGPDHNKTFKVAVSIDNRQRGVGRGKSKKEAEQMAARQAIADFNQ